MNLESPGEANRVLSVATRFEGCRHALRAEKVKAGHIHDTWRVDVERHRASQQLIVQRINRSVFRNPADVLQNIVLVTEHLAKRVSHLPDANRRVLRLIPAEDGALYVVDSVGDWWRAFICIRGARSYDSARQPAIARAVASAFGEFSRHLADFPADTLAETIPHFHDTPKRYDAFLRAVKRDACGRARAVREEIQFFTRRENDMGTLQRLIREGRIPMRVAHNDCKINNVLIDDQTGEGLCVIDLDTVMPGSLLFDVGDLIRTATCPAPEDERNLERVQIDDALFQAVAEGFLAGCRGMLSREEAERIVFAGQLITLETAMRFLTDYLEGDTYFRVDRPDHNLDRCRAQCRLVECIERRSEDLEQIVNDAWRSVR